MNETRKHGVDWGTFILGVLFILVSLISFQDPLGNLLAIVLVFAIFAIVKGIFELVIRRKIKNLTGYKTYVPIVVGVIDILVGVYLLFNLEIGVTLLPIIFALWFILDSFLGLFTLDSAQIVGSGYFWFSLIINILGIIVGILLVMSPITSALTISFLVGFYFMLFGITNIVYAFK